MSKRRELLKLVSGTTLMAAVGPFSVPRAAAADRLTVIAHAVHKNAATTGAGGDVLATWRSKAGADVEWLTFGVEAVNERAFKEASLAEGSADVVFILDRYTGPQFAGLFEDLRAWQAKDPIPDFAEIPAGMLAAHTFGGKLTAIPFRHATHGLHYNTEFFAERGVSAAPANVEQALSIAERLTFKRADGVQVYGLVMNFDDPATPIDWIRGYGGDFISQDYKVVVDQPAAVRGVSVICDLYRKGVIPKNSLSLKTEDVTTFMQQGRAAMTNNPFNRYINYNDAKASKYVGKIAVVPLPLAVNGKPIPAKTSVWAMAIPRNGRNKDRAWSMIRHLSLRENTIAATLNGNGPVRPSAYEDAKVRALIPYASAERDALASAKLVVPGFANAAKSMDIFIEELGHAMLGNKEPQAAMSEVRKRVQPLLPT
ncbi:MAG TPA: extracellular solute-binding protein [Casimicrobiaceae bacterium]|nr:extracellular solute-binding protein [Casimicrobiaceae bacterium]